MHWGAMPRIHGNIAAPGYFKQACLVEQAWVKDNKKTIQNLLDDAGAALGEKIAVGRFARFRVGEA